jgi:hypothetical protein
MRDKEIVGLYQAYLDVYSNSNEEVGQLDEDFQGAVDDATRRVQSGLEKLGLPINRTPQGTTTQKQQQEKIKPVKVKEEVAELEEISKELSGRVVNARIARTGRAFDREMKDRTPENMRATVDAVDKEKIANKLAAGVRKRRNATNEEVEKLDEEAPERITKPTKNPKLMKKGGPARVHNPKNVDEETDVFTQVLEYLVAEGFADTNESALAIMANMSEEWRQSIVEDAYAAARAKYNAMGGDAKAKQLGVLDKSGNYVDDARRKYNAMGGDAKAKQLGVMK